MENISNQTKTLETPKKYWGIIIVMIILLGWFIARVYSERGLFEYIGIDFRLWYSTGLIAKFHGFNQIYNNVLQAFYQKPLYDMALLSEMSMQFWPLPLPYFPFFTILMVPLSFVQPIIGFVLWTFINIIGYSLYVYHFCRQNKINIPIYYHVALFLSLPVFLNFFLGQINLVMLIALGETITELRKGHEFKAGFWLSGLLLKPQTLIILLPLLFIQKRFKVLYGMVAGSITIIMISVFLAGETAISGPYSVILNWTTLNHQDIIGDSGTTFFSLFLNLVKIFPNYLAIAIPSLLTILTVYLIVRICTSKNKQGNYIDDNIFLLLTYSVTCTITPHSNIHMLIPIIPLLILAIHQKQIQAKIVLAWIFIPTTSFLLAGLISTEFAHVVGGLSVLLVNLYILFWKVITVKKNSQLSI